MKAQVIKKVNTRKEAGTGAAKLNPLDVGSNIDVVKLERGELYRGSSQWLVADSGNRHWAGAFNLNTGSSYFQKYGIDQLWNTSHGEGVKVGLIDCGVQPANTALKGFDIKQVLPQVADVGIHGSYMAAILGARNFGDNYLGIAPACELYSASYANENSIQVNEVKEGINALTEAQVVNMSFATNLVDFNPERNPAGAELDQLLKNKASTGKILVAATGNNGRHSHDDFFFYPAHYAATISVGGGFMENGKYFIESISNHWDGVDILGPVSVFFDLLPGSEALFQGRTVGTSVTAALVSGILSLAYAKLSTTTSGLTKSKIIELIADPITARSKTINEDFKTNWLSTQKIKSLMNTAIT